MNFGNFILLALGAGEGGTAMVGGRGVVNVFSPKTEVAGSGSGAMMGAAGGGAANTGAGAGGGIP